MNAQVQAFDANKNPILCQSIVEVRGDSLWCGFQGLVVAPYSELEGEGYTVAVFLDRDIPSSDFNGAYFPEIDDWDAQYQEQLKTLDRSFLLKDDCWQKCPRVVFFQPNELLIQDSWSIQTLAKRVFPYSHHTLYNWPKGITPISSRYRCFCSECSSIATQIALFNVWGSVYPMHVCEECFTKIHGWCGDDLPKIKKPFLLATGEPVA
jgi:hypothetical protein